MVMKPDLNVKPVAKGNGVYLFLGIGRTDFELEIHINGYESEKVKVMFEKMDENIPIMEVYMLQKENSAKGGNILTLRGKLPGIQTIEAVSLTNVVCCYKEYDKVQNILKVFNQHSVEIKDVHYGIIDVNSMKYEHFEVKEELSTQEIRLKNKLEKEYTVNQPISRVIFGKANDDEYILTVTCSKHLNYLVRYVVNDSVHFKKIDFSNLNGQSL